MTVDSNYMKACDLDPQWLAGVWVMPEPSRPLSSADVNMYFCVEAGQDSGLLEISTVTDDLVEAAEQTRIDATVRLGSQTFSYALTGQVTDSSPAR